jgi:hypothetical protein
MKLVFCIFNESLYCTLVFDTMAKRHISIEEIKNKKTGHTGIKYSEWWDWRLFLAHTHRQPSIRPPMVKP